VGLDAGLASRAHMLVFNVQRTQLHNERTVEKIVRERSANGMNLASCLSDIVLLILSLSLASAVQVF
jgi:hypothetical protein